MRTCIDWLSQKEQKLTRWEHEKPGRFTATYLRVYTICFLVLSLITVAIFLSGMRDIIWSVDGFQQYYPYFIYVGDWIRSIIGSVFSGQGLQIPMWNWNLGYGGDNLLMLDVIYDPINWLSALAPGALSEYMFQFCLFLRLFLAGLTFSLYALHRGCGRFSTLIGALVYSFCISSVVVFSWPGGISGLILFPLVLLGADRIFEHRSPVCFIVSMFLLAAISYYFAYMTCLALLVYCTIGAIRSEEHPSVRTFLIWVARFAGYLIVALLLASIVLVPSINELLSMSRVNNTSVDVNPFYSLKYYLNFIGGWLAGTNVGSDCYVGFSGISLICAIVLFTQRHKHKLLKGIFIACTLCMLLPYVGSLTNGFNYPTNRWVWIYTFCIAYIVVRIVPTLIDLTHRQKHILFGSIVAYILIVFLIPQIRTEYNIAAIACLIVVAGVVLAPGFSKNARRYALLASVIIGLSCNLFYTLSSSEGGWSKANMHAGTAYSILTDRNPDSLLQQVNDDSGFWRYDADPSGVEAVGESYTRCFGDNLTLGLNGIQFYNSLYNDNIDRFHTEMGIARDNINFQYGSLGGRSMLDVICGVSYYLCPVDSTITSAYNYNDQNEIVAEGQKKGSSYQPGTYCVYEGTETLPVGFAYTSTISRETYDNLTPAQRQQALLQGVVIDSQTDETASDDSAASSTDNTTTNGETNASSGKESATTDTSSTDVASTSAASSVTNVSSDETSTTTDTPSDNASNTSTTSSDTSDIPETDLTFTDQSIDYTSTPGAGATLNEDGSITATKTGATVTLTLNDALENSETYLYVKGLDHEAQSAAELTSGHTWDSLPWYKKVMMSSEDLTYSAATDYSISAQADNGSANRKIINSQKSYHMYGGKDTWLLNLGYSDKAQHTVTLTFSQPGTYTFDEMDIVCQPMDSFDSQVETLQTDTLQNVSTQCNCLTGTIDSHSSELLYLSIPYSKGWTAYVDGVQTDIQKANTAFMALKVEPGEHSIELRYTTPKIGTGALMSGVGLIALIAIVVFRRMRSKQRVLHREH